MSLDEIFEAAVAIEKTVWRRRGGKTTRKDVRRTVAAEADPHSRTTIKVTDGKSN